ncbi:MAG: glutamine-hydrolyzing carbamoyl-phosphate synthase small subunit [Anaerohalosphaeraceae bacterium]|nr:glutamine-hydrolyzing carbamoyl-phosphate synthase small subunit [Anaerohalosphaeraceae bacterium]
MLKEDIEIVEAILLLEDGAIFRGKGFGAKGKKCGEVVFNTSMSGYQEILTDPSYNEQIVTMTYPLIGNYGINALDVESNNLYLSGFIVKENCDYPSSWRNEITLSNYLKKNNIIALEDIDTRKLVKHIRTAGAMKGIICSDGTGIEELKKELAAYPGLIGRDLVQNVTTDKSYQWDKPVVNVLTGDSETAAPKYNVAAIDFGIKQNILRMLVSCGCNVTVYPAGTSAEDILAKKPDGVFLSNGPGDPEPVDYAIETIKKLLGKVPIFGICLGHQLLGLAMGGKSFKLKFGHHGANHPVKHLCTDKIEITSQNHGFCIDPDSLKDKDVRVTHINLNDNTLEGFACNNTPAFAVQYHPEASPGPHDSAYLFEKFTSMMDAF